MKVEYLPRHQRVRISHGVGSVTMTVTEAIEAATQLSKELQRFQAFYQTTNKAEATHRVWTGDSWTYLVADKDTDVLVYAMNKNTDRMHTHRKKVDADGIYWWQPM